MTQTAPATPLPPALDEAVIARLRRELDPEGKHDIIGRILRTYENSLLTMLQRLEDARRRDDAQEVADVAHKMKSSSSAVGATALAARCDAVDRAIRSGQRVDTPAEVETLLTEAGRALQAVRAMLNA